MSNNVIATTLTFCIDVMSSIGNPVNAPVHFGAGVFLSLESVISDHSHDTYTLACAG